MRTAEEILMRCKPILDQPDIILLVEKSGSPTAVYDMVLLSKHKPEIAKAARWLGVLKRDYPTQYAEVTKNTLSQVPKNTAKKGNRHES